LQTAFMFVGEFFCFGLYHIKNVLRKGETKPDEE